jgi:ParB family chromosome partitioning protein
MARRGLGRGLDALIPRAAHAPADTAPDETETTDPAPDGSGLLQVPVGAIRPSPSQPRRDFDTERLQELAESIREQGLIQPVVLRRRDDGYEIIAGERRWRAVTLLEWPTVPAVLMDTSDAKMRELALVENLQRDDLSPVETALAYQALQDDLHLTHEAIARRIGISRAAVTNTLRLLDLPNEVRQLVAENRLSAGSARALLALDDAASQIRLARRAAEKKLSVRDVEQAVQKAAGASPRRTARGDTRASARAKDPAVRDLEERLGRHLGTRVTIDDRDGTGTIRIAYYSHDDVERILRELGLDGDLD